MNSQIASITEKRNLDDWLSPILVKELRQGMRARAFIISFLLLQAFLVLLVVGNVAAQEDRNALDFQNNIFWVIIGFVLLALMPLRGLVTISSEIKNHTLETIMLTRLTAWRVVFGKWSALFAQSLLLVSAVLPFVVLRYFIGGDDVVSDFELILFMLWLSGILIAISIAISAMANAVIRIVIIVGVVSLMGALTDNSIFSSLDREGPWGVLGWLLIFGFFLPALLFELTASGIAPASENHAIRRRVLALLFFISACLLEWGTKDDFQGGVIIPFLILIGVCYFELAEKPRLLPRMVQAMIKSNPLGRIGTFFLLPGWPSALLFSLLCIPLSMGIIFYFKPPTADLTFPWILPLFAILGSVLMPIFICHLFWPKMKQVLLMIFLYNIILMGLTAVLDGFATLTHSEINNVLGFVPGLPVIMVEGDGTRIKDHQELYLFGNGITLSFLILMLLVSCRGYYRELFAIFLSSATVIPQSNDTTGKTTP